MFPGLLFMGPNQFLLIGIKVYSNLVCHICFCGGRLPGLRPKLESVLVVSRATPLFSAWVKVFPSCASLLEKLQENYKYWDKDSKINRFVTEENPPISISA
uniref:Uncharacterized protein n=1 Tax=Polyblepharides amylifera TaxID=1486889 RepID=A0A7R9SWK9_9CHLO